MPQKPHIALIAAVSTDGFIARRENEPSGTWTSAEDKKFLKSKLQAADWLVMGRHTYTLHQAMFNPYACMIFSNAPAPADQLDHVWVNPLHHHPLTKLEALGAKNVVILGGTRVYDYFTNRSLADELWLTIEPVTFGQGIPLFSAPDNLDEFWLLESEKPLNDTGTLLRHYTPR